MLRAADLEIGLHRRDGASYTVEMRLLPPGADEEVRPGSGSMEVDLDALRAETNDIAYGEQLGGALLGDPAVRSAFDGRVSTMCWARSPNGLLISCKCAGRWL